MGEDDEHKEKVLLNDEDMLMMEENDLLGDDLEDFQYHIPPEINER